MPKGRKKLGPQEGLGRAVRRLREEAGLSQAVLASRSGLSPSTIIALEGGKRNPTWGTARRIANGMGVSLETLAEIAEDLEDR